MNLRKKYFLMEGQLMITTASLEIVTVLGSCVSVCLWDRKLNIAGMNHYLLPGDEHDDAGNANRGMTSIPLLINSMIRRSCRIENIEAKVFGGSNSLYVNSTKFEIGKKNIEVSLSVLKNYSIPVVARDTGGICGRKIIYNTRTGKVLVRLLNKPLTVINEEIHKGFGV